MPYTGSISDPVPEAPIRCTQCRQVCTSLYAAVFMRGSCKWRPFCFEHAKALAKRQYLAAGKQLRAHRALHA